MGENKMIETKEIEALRKGIEQILNLIDTIEIYGKGGAESVVGKAISLYKRRDIFMHKSTSM